MMTISKSAKVLVSVIVPNYNHARFLPQRLDSILAQTFKDYELIVLDDASTDNSREVIESYAAKHPMRLVFNKENSGNPFIQWRKGAELARGQYVWMAESDDSADPKLLETLMAEFTGNARVGLAYCQSHTIDENGRNLGTCQHLIDYLDPEHWQRSFVNSGVKEVAHYLVQRNTIPNASAVVVRRDIFLSSSERSPQYRLAGDWWTWVHVLLASDIAFVAQPLNYFRTHQSSVRNGTNLAAACIEDLKIRTYLCSRLPIPMAVRYRSLTETIEQVSICLDESGGVSKAWFREVKRLARIVHPAASIRLAWVKGKRPLKRFPLLVRVVRCGRRLNNRLRHLLKHEKIKAPPSVILW